MSLTFDEICIDAHDASALGAWWSTVLGWPWGIDADGDVVLHAIADAILGAAGLGDLGRVFPAGPETPAGIASSELIDEVVRRAAAAGFAIASVDVTIVAARPRLADRLDDMGRRAAELLAVEPSAVNVKASTGNLAGMEGAGRGISAQAVVTLVVVG